MSSTKFPNLGTSSIRQVVLARHVAQRFKLLSTNLVIKKRRNADKGDYQVTHTDEPEFNEVPRRIPLVTETGSSHRRSTGNFSGLSFLKSQTPQNTYLLEPTEHFQCSKVQRIIEETLESELKDLSYSPELCSQKSKILCDSIKAKVKGLKFSRYKYIVVVFIGQKNGQSARVASRCVWDTRFDNYAQYVHEGTSDIFAIGTVYGLYHE